MPTPTPKYKTLQQHGAIEIRAYPKLLVANTYDQLPQKSALYRGFKRLANYIFGNNLSSLSGKTAHSIPMTAPVRIQKTERAPGSYWQTQFIMPDDESLADIPQPAKNTIQLQEIPPSCMACIRFTGLWRANNFRRHADALRTWLATQNQKHNPKAIYCYYNPPWSIPWLRRNEVMFQLLEGSQPQPNES